MLPGSGPQGSVVPSDTWRSMWLRSSDLFGIFACLIIPDTILIMRMRRNLAIVEVVQALRTSTSAQAPIDAHSLQRPWWYNACTYMPKKSKNGRDHVYPKLTSALVFQCDCHGVIMMCLLFVGRSLAVPDVSCEKYFIALRFETLRSP